jgi:hypothetical protein
VCICARLTSRQLTLFQIAPLLFDTVVTLMTVLKAFAIRRRNGGPNSPLIQTFLREGAYSASLTRYRGDEEIFRRILLPFNFYR